MQKIRDYGLGFMKPSSRDDLKLKINSPCSCAKSHVKLYQDGVSEGYEIVCMDGSFHVHEYCLYNSEFLYNMLKGFDSTVYLARPGNGELGDLKW